MCKSGGDKVIGGKGKALRVQEVILSKSKSEFSIICYEIVA